MKCDICGRNDNECRIKKVNNICYCPKHLTQHYRYGKCLDRTIYDKNEIIQYSDYAKIVIRDKKQTISGYAIIDLDDVALCSQYKWHMRKSGNSAYAIASLPDGRRLHLHRLVIGYNGEDDVDHINHDGLDNRKSNLRVVSHADNIRNQRDNRKGIKLVGSGRYQATITKNYVCTYLGTYDTYEEALLSRKRAEQ